MSDLDETWLVMRSCGSLNFKLALVLAVTVATVAVSAPWALADNSVERAAASESYTQASEEPLNAADELYSDGMDALADGNPQVARELFEYLIEHHPAAKVAPLAAKELDKLNGFDEANTETSPSPPAAAMPPPPAGAAQAPLTAPGTAATAEPTRESAPGNAQPVAVPAPPAQPVQATPIPPANTALVAPPVRRREDIGTLTSAFTRVIGDRIFFAETSADVGGRARSVITAQARWLAMRPYLSVHIIGHADDPGSAAENFHLSEKRAEVVRKVLIEAGVAPEMITVEGAGAGQPVAVCPEALCRAQNRRAVATIAIIESNRRASAQAGPSASPGPATPSAPR